jgi:glycosyltransferase involved in cell wall biosynthesis
MGNPKTVAFINHTAVLGGGEYALQRLINAMDQRFWCPVVVFGEEGPAAELLRKKSVETYVLPMGPSLRQTRRQDWSGSGCLNISRVFEAGRFILRIQRFLGERAPDLVHTNSLKSHLLAGIAAKWAGIPVVWHLRDLIELAHLPLPAVRQIRFLAARIPQAIITVSKCVASEIHANGNGSEPKRTRVIYDGLEEEAFSETATRADRDNRTWRVGIAGRLAPWKGQHLVLQAASILKSKGYAIEWEVVGGALFGEDLYEKGLKNQARELGLHQEVNFSGQVSDVARRLRTWDVSVHASTAPDPCPNVVLESMAAGVPVVGPAAGGVPELLEHGQSGELFAMGQAPALAGAIERLLLSRERRLQIARHARHRAETLFRSERVAREVEDVWRRILEEGGRIEKPRNWIEAGELSPTGQ